MQIGPVKVGSDHPVALQTMTTTDTRDVQATVDQVCPLIFARPACSSAGVSTLGLAPSVQATVVCAPSAPSILCIGGLLQYVTQSLEGCCHILCGSHTVLLQLQWTSTVQCRLQGISCTICILGCFVTRSPTFVRYLLQSRGTGIVLSAVPVGRWSLSGLPGARHSSYVCRVR